MGKRFAKIYVEITNICNLNCSFCSISNLAKKEMSVSQFINVIDKIKNYTDNIYLHVKGEPLLHTHLDEILSICNKNKINIRITTNGTLLKRKLAILLKHDIKQINVSLHCENKINDYYKSVFDTCDILSNKTTIIYRLWTLPSLKLDKLSTNIVDKIISHYKISTDIVEKIMNDKNIKIKDNIYIDKDYEFIWPKVDSIKCDVGTCLGTKSHIAILSNGDVVPCCLDSEGIIKLGNIFENNLDEILATTLFKEINQGFNNNKIINDLCRSCTYRNRFKKG